MKLHTRLCSRQFCLTHLSMRTKSYKTDAKQVLHEALYEAPLTRKTRLKYVLSQNRVHGSSSIYILSSRLMIVQAFQLLSHKVQMKRKPFFWVLFQRLNVCVYVWALLCFWLDWLALWSAECLITGNNHTLQTVNHDTAGNPQKSRQNGFKFHSIQLCR